MVRTGFVQDTRLEKLKPEIAPVQQIFGRETGVAEVYGLYNQPVMGLRICITIMPFLSGIICWLLSPNWRLLGFVH